MTSKRTIFRRLVLDNPPGRFQQWLHAGGAKPSKEAVDAVSEDVVAQIRNGLHDPSMAVVARSWFATARQAVPEATDAQCVAFAAHKANVLWEDMVRSMGREVVRKVEHPIVNEPDWAA